MISFFFRLNCRFFIDGLAMSNFHTNTADNRKPSVSSNSEESNRINKEPSCSLLNTTNFEFIDADINSGSNGVSKLTDGTNCMSKTGCAGCADESPVSKIGNYYFSFLYFYFRWSDKVKSFLISIKFIASIFSSHFIRNYNTRFISTVKFRRKLYSSF